jgi:SulP family sulfate permease
VLVTVVTIFTDLAIAVGLGIVASSLVFAWKKGNNILIDYSEVKDGVKEYYVKGVLFFGSAANFNERFNPSEDPDKVVVNFIHARIFDYSGVEALVLMSEKYSKLGKSLSIKNVSKDSKKMLDRSDHLGKVKLFEE